MAKDSPRPPDATDERLLAVIREVLTHGQPEWTRNGPEVWTQLTVEKMALDELGCESWAGVPPDWMRPAIAPLLQQLVAEGWAATKRGPFERRINGDLFWRRVPLSLEEWARVAEAQPYWFPWRRAALERARLGPHLDERPSDRNPVVAIAVELLRSSGPVRVARFLDELGRAALACGGEPGDVTVLAAGVGRGLLQRLEERMRLKGDLAFVLPPAPPAPKRGFALLEARTLGLARPLARAWLGLPAEPPTPAQLLPLPPRGPRQLALPF